MPELHPLLAGRWSPRAFDPVAVLTAAELASLVEAARWAPSAANSQPWRFVIGLRDEETHKRMLANLAADDQRWAGAASALIMAGYVVDGGRSPARAAYDLGQAVAHLSVQASALGLSVHQMDGFDPGFLRADLDLPTSLEPAVVLAVGHLASPDSLPPDLRRREIGLRHRRPAESLLIAVT
jgi:nitroreductase